MFNLKFVRKTQISEYFCGNGKSFFSDQQQVRGLSNQLCAIFPEKKAIIYIT